MSAIASMSCNDSASVTHVYTPIQTVPAEYRNIANTAIPTIAQEVVDVVVKKASNPEGINRVIVTLKMASLENTASGVGADGYTAPPKVAYFNLVKCEFLLPNRGTTLQRTDLRTLIISLLAKTNIIDAVDNLSPPY
jgi:hypothetical protein